MQSLPSKQAKAIVRYVERRYKHDDGGKNSLLEKYDGSDEKDWLHRKPILHYW